MFSNINIEIDYSKCLGCGICVERCILDNLRLAVPPCRAACPLHMNCQGYIRYIAMGEESKAAEHLRQYTPFANLLSRVCTAPCESECFRKEMDGESVNIRALKRYLSDNYENTILSAGDTPKASGLSVAIIGSGPAGLAAAYELRSKGHAVKVFDREEEPGGLLRWALPEFRLPVAEIRKSVAILEQMGILFECNTSVDLNGDLQDLASTYGAIIIATGAGGEKALPGISQETIDGVYSGLEVLKQVRQGRKMNLGNSVLVIGGGNSAVDSRLWFAGVQALMMSESCAWKPKVKCLLFHLELKQAVDEGINVVNGFGIGSIDHGRSTAPSGFVSTSAYNPVRRPGSIQPGVRRRVCHGCGSRCGGLGYWPSCRHPGFSLLTVFRREKSGAYLVWTR